MSDTVGFIIVGVLVFVVFGPIFIEMILEAVVAIGEMWGDVFKRFKRAPDPDTPDD